jgi:AcrR family transcriptional regulator
VIEATLRHLAEDGYPGMSIESIAASAGVGKPTIYRRWRSKAELATEALQHYQSREPAATGDTTRERLVAHLRAFRRSLLRPNGMAMLGTILAEEQRTPELFRLFMERIVVRRRAMLKAILERGVKDGEVLAEADLDAAVAMLVGSFYARYLASGTVPEAWPERAVSLVWPGIACRRS